MRRPSAARRDASVAGTGARRSLALAFVLAVVPGAWAQEAPRATATDQPPVASGESARWSPQTGDAWLDARLDDMNAYAVRYPDAFVEEIARYHEVPREVAQALVADRRWTPGDAYMACAVAEVAGRACRDVAGEWRRDHAEGWQAVAARIGVEKGSDAFERLRRGVVHAYDRWNRPVELDAALRRAFTARDSRPYRWSPPAP